MPLIEQLNKNAMVSPGRDGRRCGGHIWKTEHQKIESEGIEEDNGKLLLRKPLGG